MLKLTTKPNNKNPFPNTTLVYKGCNNDVYVTCQSLSMHNIKGGGGHFTLPIYMTPHACIKEYLKMFLAYKINIAWDGILPPSFVK